MAAERCIGRGEGRHGLVVLIAAALGCTGSSGPVAEPQDGLHMLEVADIGLEAPVSIVHDSLDDVYLVVNAARGGVTPFISRLRPDGAVQHQRWIDGAADGVRLRTPAGMAMRGDSLYVADGACLRVFNRSTGAVAGSLCPPGAIALNDAAVDRRSRLYVSDSASGAVYVIDGSGAITGIARDSALIGNGGLAAGERGVFVAGAGLYQLRPEGLRTVIRDQGKRLGGIVFTADGSFAFSNRSDATVLFVEAKNRGSEGSLWTLVDSIPSAGDLGYDARRERILIPELGRNRLVFISLEPE